MAQVENKVLLPNIQRNVEDEFPNQRISDFLVTEVEKLKERYGDEQLFVSRFSSKILLPCPPYFTSLMTPTFWCFRRTGTQDHA